MCKQLFKKTIKGFFRYLIYKIFLVDHIPHPKLPDPSLTSASSTTTTTTTTTMQPSTFHGGIFLRASGVPAESSTGAPSAASAVEVQEPPAQGHLLWRYRSPLHRDICCGGTGVPAQGHLLWRYRSPLHRDICCGGTGVPCTGTSAVEVQESPAQGHLLWRYRSPLHRDICCGGTGAPCTGTSAARRALP